MGDLRVPWAEGRRALIRMTFDGGEVGAWQDAVGGLVGGGPVWEFQTQEGDTDGYEWERWSPESVPLPGQCSVCYGVGDHTTACIVARNVTAGCPPWIAHVASTQLPDNFHERWFDDLFLVHDDGALLQIYFGEEYGTGEPYAVACSTGYDLFKGWPCTTGDIDPEWRWFVRIGRDGPLAPWEV